jgi:hypothetical protein
MPTNVRKSSAARGTRRKPLLSNNIIDDNVFLSTLPPTPPASQKTITTSYFPSTTPTTISTSYAPTSQYITNTNIIPPTTSFTSPPQTTTTTTTPWRSKRQRQTQSPQKSPRQLQPQFQQPQQPQPKLTEMGGGKARRVSSPRVSPRVSPKGAENFVFTKGSRSSSPKLSPRAVPEPTDADAGERRWRLVEVPTKFRDKIRGPNRKEIHAKVVRTSETRRSSLPALLLDEVDEQAYKHSPTNGPYTTPSTPPNEPRLFQTPTIPPAPKVPTAPTNVSLPPPLPAKRISKAHNRALSMGFQTPSVSPGQGTKRGSGSNLWGPTTAAATSLWNARNKHTWGSECATPNVSSPIISLAGVGGSGRKGSHPSPLATPYASTPTTQKGYHSPPRIPSMNSEDLVLQQWVSSARSAGLFGTDKPPKGKRRKGSQEEKRMAEGNIEMDPGRAYELSLAFADHSALLKGVRKELLSLSRVSHSPLSHREKIQRINRTTGRRLSVPLPVRARIYEESDALDDAILEWDDPTANNYLPIPEEDENKNELLQHSSDEFSLLKVPLSLSSSDDEVMRAGEAPTTATNTIITPADIIGDRRYVYVGQMPLGTTRDAVKQLFALFGEVATATPCQSVPATDISHIWDEDEPATFTTTEKATKPDPTNPTGPHTHTNTNTIHDLPPDFLDNTLDHLTPHRPSMLLGFATLAGARTCQQRIAWGKRHLKCVFGGPGPEPPPPPPNTPARISKDFDELKRGGVNDEVKSSLITQLSALHSKSSLLDANLLFKAQNAMTNALKGAGVEVEIPTPPSTDTLAGSEETKTSTETTKQTEQKTEQEELFAALDGSPLPWVVGSVTQKPAPITPSLTTTLRVDAPEYIPSEDVEKQQAKEHARRRDKKKRETVSLSMKSLPMGGSRRDPEELAPFMHLHVLQVFTYLKKLREAHTNATASTPTSPTER